MMPALLDVPATDEERADDRGDDRERAHDERKRGGARQDRPEQQMTQQHRGGRRDDVGLEEVGGHAGAVADVVADVVRDHGRIARVVLGDARFDFTDEVGADVGRLGENSAAQTGEHRDQRAAEGETDQRGDRCPSSPLLTCSMIQ